MKIYLASKFENKNPANINSYAMLVLNYNNEDLIIGKLDFSLTQTTFNKLENHKNLICRHSRNHPVSIMVNEKSGKIFSLSKSGRGLIIQLVYKHHPLSSDIIDNIISLLIADTFITQNGDRTITVKKESDLTAIDIEKIFSLFISKIQL